MADRPVFVPATNEPAFVREVTLSIPWSPGFAVVQKQKNIVALRDAAAAVGIAPVLEVSTKSEEKLGRPSVPFTSRFGHRAGRCR